MEKGRARTRGRTKELREYIPLRCTPAPEPTLPLLSHSLCLSPARFVLCIFPLILSFPLFSVLFSVHVASLHTHTRTHSSRKLTIYLRAIFRNNRAAFNIFLWLIGRVTFFCALLAFSLLRIMEVPIGVCFFSSIVGAIDKAPPHIARIRIGVLYLLSFESVRLLRVNILFTTKYPFIAFHLKFDIDFPKRVVTL